MEEGTRIHVLPRPGPARLRREEVAASQLGRMATAMVECAAEKGFARTTVADVIARAGVSRKTFYEHFRDKDECFLKAYDAAVEITLQEIAEALAQPGTAIQQLDRLLDAYLRTMASEPAWAKTYLVEIYAAGPEAIKRRRTAFEQFVALLQGLQGRLREEGQPVKELDRLGFEALVGGISTIVTLRVAEGRAGDLPSLHGGFLRLLMDGLLAHEQGPPAQAAREIS